MLLIAVRRMKILKNQMSKIKLFHPTRLLLVGMMAGGPSVHAQQPVAPPPAVSAQKPALPASTETGTLSLSVVVLDDLMPRPVALTDFRITADFGSRAEQILRTDENGVLSIALPPGSYVLESVRPAKFKGLVLSWKSRFSIQAGQTATLKLTDADATAATISAVSARQISDEAKVYQSLKNGVVTVECDFGSGSGFVVDKRGLILTNQHVVNETHQAVIRFGRGLRFPATVVMQDKDADVAVLAFNPDAFKTFVVIPLADTTAGSVAVEGEKVLAIGSPLQQEKILTVGIISKVEKDVLISDVNINHGNSGGPLLNLAGEAVGLTTFLDPGSNGPGISGIVAINKALPVLKAAQDKLAALPPPPATSLPDIAEMPVPGKALMEAALTTRKPYFIDAPKNFQIILYTPFTIASIDAAAEREVDKGRNARVRKRGERGVKEVSAIAPSRFWERYAIGDRDAVVPIMVRPVLRETRGSHSRGVFGAILGGLAGVPVRTQTNLEFRDDFYDMELKRGTQVLLPVRQARERASVLYDNPLLSVKDTAYGGIYFYDPQVFEPSQPLIIRMRRESNLQAWDEVRLDPKMQRRIWDEFAPYRDAQPSPSPMAVSTSPSSPPNPTASTVPPAKSIPSLPRAPRLPEIKTFPQRVRLETSNGNSYIGNVTAFDGSVYTLVTRTETQKIKASERLCEK